MYHWIISSENPAWFWICAGHFLAPIDVNSAKLLSIAVGSNDYIVHLVTVDIATGPVITKSTIFNLTIKIISGSVSIFLLELP